MRITIGVHPFGETGAPEMKRNLASSLISHVLGLLLLAAPAASRADTLYVGTLYDGNIIQVSSNGQQSLFASGVYEPQQMVFDNAGNLFVASNGDVIKFAPDGTRNTYATNVYASGLAFDSVGNLFASDFNTGDIIRIATNGAQTIVTTLNNSSALGGLAFDLAGNLYVGRWNGTTITKITPNGTQSIFASGIDNCNSLVFDSSGNLLVLNAGYGTIVSIATNGAQHTVGGGLPYNFAYPTQIAIDKSDNVYVSDVPAGSIYKMSPNGQINLFASGLPYAFSMAMDTIPEPGTAALLAFGCITLAVYRLCHRRVR
jgi:sugar lactone lactonase YvrE